MNQHDLIPQDRNEAGSFDDLGVFAERANFARLSLVGLKECRAKVRKRVHPERHLCAGGKPGKGLVALVQSTG